MIQEAAQRAGLTLSEWVLNQILGKLQISFQNLVGEIARSRDPQAARYLWAELNDFLEGLSSEEFSRTVHLLPKENLKSFAANFLAAMVEYAAFKKDAKTPAWTDKISPLEQPYFGSELSSLRAYLLSHSPAPFRRRNIFVDASLGDRK